MPSAYIPKYPLIVAPLSDWKTWLLKGAPKGGKERKD
jgi:phage terminase large subunit-like protein